MNKKVLIFILLLTILFSGCVEQIDEKETETINYVVSDVYTSRGVERKIEYVYVEVQNFEDEDIMITIDFGFALLDLDELGQHSGGGGTSGESGDIWEDAYHIQKHAVIRAHDIETIYYTPKLRYDNKIEYEWEYEITASFN